LEAGGEGGGGEKEVGGDESQRRLDIRNVGDMSGLFNAVSSKNSDHYNTGNNIISNGDRVEVALGTYQCNESGTNCAALSIMLYPNNLYGSIECTNDTADCILDGEKSRRLICAEEIAEQPLTLRALTFKDGQGNVGGGLFIYNALVNIILCVFSSCRAEFVEGEFNSGGAIEAGGSLTVLTVVNIYATSFMDNIADNGEGNDIYKDLYATITVHNICPSPYSSTNSTVGKRTYIVY